MGWGDFIGFTVSMPITKMRTLRALFNLDNGEPLHRLRKRLYNMPVIVQMLLSPDKDALFVLYRGPDVVEDDHGVRRAVLHPDGGLRGNRTPFIANWREGVARPHLPRLPQTVRARADRPETANEYFDGIDGELDITKLLVPEGEKDTSTERVWRIVKVEGGVALSKTRRFIWMKRQSAKRRAPSGKKKRRSKKKKRGQGDAADKN